MLAIFFPSKLSICTCARPYPVWPQTSFFPCSIPFKRGLTPTSCILLAPLSLEFCLGLAIGRAGWQEFGWQNERRSWAISSPLFTSGSLSSKGSFSSLSSAPTQDTCYGPSFCQVMLGFGLCPILGSNGFPLLLISGLLCCLPLIWHLSSSISYVVNSSH